MATLHHGTTLFRAKQIIATGPDPDFTEPGGTRSEGFSTSLASGPFPLGKPEQYAIHKAKLFSHEGGPVILEIEVPDEIVLMAIDSWYPLSQGVIQFDEDRPGLVELREVWASLSKQIIPVDNTC